MNNTNNCGLGAATIEHTIQSLTSSGRRRRRQVVAPAPVISSNKIDRGISRVHKTTQHSETLSRRYVKPTSLQPTVEHQSEPIVATYSPVNLQQVSAKSRVSPEVCTCRYSCCDSTATDTSRPSAEVEKQPQSHLPSHRKTRREAEMRHALLPPSTTMFDASQAVTQPKELKSSRTEER